MEIHDLISAKTTRELRHQKSEDTHKILRKSFDIIPKVSKGSRKKQTSNNFYQNNDTFEFTRHVSVVQRPSSVESRGNKKLHLNL